jgi:hypothetical protein
LESPDRFISGPGLLRAGIGQNPGEIERCSGGRPVTFDFAPGQLGRRFLINPVLLVAAANPADRAVVTLDRDGPASSISAIISVGAIRRSIVIAVITTLWTHSHTAGRCIDRDLSERRSDRYWCSETRQSQQTGHQQNSHNVSPG